MAGSFSEISGYGLLEQIIVMTIMMAALMSSWSLVNKTLQAQKRRSVVKRLQTAVDTGRQLSLLEHKRFLLKADNAGWASGWSLIDGDGRLIRKYHGPHQGRLAWYGSFGEHSVLSYHADGTLEQQGHFCYCQNGQGCLGLAVNRSGSYTVSIDSCTSSSADT